jgi:hypothetical protein
MKENVKEASVVMAKCRQSKMPFGIRIEKRTDNVWYCNWAFKLTEKVASNEGYGSVMISGKVDMDSEYPGCPYCETGGWFTCGNCGKMTCYGGEEQVTCAWCGHSGGVRSSDTFDLTGGGY